MQRSQKKFNHESTYFQVSPWDIFKGSSYEDRKKINNPHAIFNFHICRTAI